MKKYEEPKIEIINYSTEDIIKTSSEIPEMLLTQGKTINTFDAAMNIFND